MSLKAVAYDEAIIDPVIFWGVSDYALATVSTRGTVTGKAPGTVTVTAGMSGNMYEEASYTLVITQIPNGTYYLQNKQTGYYADIEGPTMTAGTTIHQWEFHGGDSQRWVFEHLGDGYYSIRSNNASSAFYLGVINDSTGLDVDIVLRSGALTDGMKWKIEKTVNGAYKIIPKTGESKGYILATTTSDGTNGAKLIQGAYIDNNSYRDEWILERSSVVFYGITNSGHDHISCLNTLSNTMSSGIWNDITVRGGAISSSKCRNDLLSTNVFTSRSHGQWIGYTGIQDVVLSTGIILNDAAEDSYLVAFYSHSWNSMSSGSTYISSNDDYTGLIVALFIGCETAKGGKGARNLPSTIVEHGALASIGFSESIGCVSANTWTENFYQKMFQGATLQEAADYACNLASESSGLNSVVICGDSSIRFPIK